MSKIKKQKNIKDIFDMVKNDGHEFVLSGEFEKIALAKPKQIVKSPDKIDLSQYIKQHPKYDRGLIKASEIKIDCYHLENNKRVISKRGVQKALGIAGFQSGNKLQEILRSYTKITNCPEKIFEVLNGIEEKSIIFVRKGGAGSQPLAHGFEDEFFMDLCHALDDLKDCELIRPEDLYLSANAKILIRAFSKLGIRSYIDEATGYIKDKKQNEYAELFEKWVLEEAGEYQPIFRTEYYKAIWRVWLQKEAPERYKKFSFFAYITRQFIYRVLARKELNYDNTALGILLKQLDEKNPDRKARHHQFLDKVGRTALDRQITAFITICDGAKNKDEFLKQFNKTFKLDGEQFEFDF